MTINYEHPLSALVHLVRSETKKPEDQSKAVHYHQHICCFL